MENFKNAVSSTLRSLRAERKLKQSEVSELANVDVMTIGRYENNPNTIVLNVLEKLINAYGIDCYIFFNLVNAKMHKLDDISSNQEGGE